MNSAELRTFLSVAASQSTSQAAELLNVSQPAVSRRIQSLEAELGIALFDRIGKRLQLNHAGKVFRPRAEEILETWRSSVSQLQDLSERVTGTLHLATSHHIGLHRLAPVLTAFRARFPDVQFHITFEDSEVTHDLVREGKIELAIATLNPKGNAELTFDEIWDDPLVFVGQVAQRVCLADLAALPCVLPGVTTYTGRIVLDRFRQHGIALEPMMSTNYLETIHMLVGVGLGWSVLPESMLGNLAALEVVDAGPQMRRRLGTITHPQRNLSNAAKAFLAVIGDYDQ